MGVVEVSEHVPIQRVINYYLSPQPGPRLGCGVGRRVRLKASAAPLESCDQVAGYLYSTPLFGPQMDTGDHMPTTAIGAAVPRTGQLERVNEQTTTVRAPITNLAREREADVLGEGHRTGQRTGFRWPAATTATGSI